MGPGRRPTKKTKITDTRKNKIRGRPNLPANVVSSSEPESDSPPRQAHENASRASVAAPLDVKGALLSLGTSHTETEAIEAIMPLERVSTTHAEEVFDLQGILLLVCSLKKFKSSNMFVNSAVRIFARMSNMLQQNREKNDQMANMLLRLGFPDILLLAAKTHPDSRTIQVNTTTTFNNFSNALQPPSKKIEFGTKEIVQFMRNAMRAYPDDTHLNDSTCAYFGQMSEVPEMKDRFWEQGVVPTLASAIDRFRQWNRYANDGERNRVEHILLHGKLAVGRIVA